MRVETIGNATLYLGDCMSVLPTIPTNEINWGVTSPPYNLHKSYHTSPGANTKANSTMSKKYQNWYADDMDEAEYQTEQKRVISDLLRICTDSLFYNHRIRYAWHSRNKNPPKCKVYRPIHWLSDFPIWCEIVWDRCGGSTPTGRYQQGHELIYQLGKPRKARKSLGMTDVWREVPSRGTPHVCAFPTKIVERCLKPHASKGEAVIDPYMGIGTVGLVAQELGLKFIGIEREPKYFDEACRRLDLAQFI